MQFCIFSNIGLGFCLYFYYVKPFSTIGNQRSINIVYYYIIISIIGTNRKATYSNGSVGEYASYEGDLDYFLMWSSWVQGNSDGPLVPMVRLAPMEKHPIKMVLLVQNKFSFTPSKNVPITIMNVPCSMSQPRNDNFAFTPSKSAL